MKVTKKVYMQLMPSVMTKGTDFVNAIVPNNTDYSSFSSDFIHIAAIDVEFELPDNILEIGAECLEKELSKLRAENHKKEQQLIDKIAGLRLLAKPDEPVEGDLLDDSGLVKREKKIDDSDAEDVLEIPF